MGLVCLPLLSRAVLCRSAQHFSLLHLLVDISDMKFSADKISNMDTLMFCSITLLLCVIIQVLR